MLVRFNPPLGWPLPPGWTPPPGWSPDPSWPPAPEGWQFWVEEPTSSHPGHDAQPPPQRTGVIAAAVVGAVILIGALALGIGQLVGAGNDPATAGPETTTSGTSSTEPATSGATTETTDPETTEPAEPETYTVTHDETGLLSAEVGACTRTELLDQDEGISTLPLMECSEVHDAEIIGMFDLDNESYPGDEEVRDLAQQNCESLFEEYIGHPFSESELEMWYIWPNETTWDNNNDREVICIAYLDGASETGSWAGTQR